MNAQVTFCEETLVSAYSQYFSDFFLKLSPTIMPHEFRVSAYSQGRLIGNKILKLTE